MAQERNIIETTNLSSEQEAKIGGDVVVVVPTVEECLQLGLLEKNLVQTEDYMNQFSNEKDTLGTTYSECRDVIRSEFEKLHDLLTQREETLLKELQIRFDERDSKIEKQINDLQNHRNNNKNIEHECKELLGTITKRKEKSERTLKITKLCQDCIKESPLLEEVPIGLNHKFLTQNKLINLINEYGKLVCKPIKSGGRRKFKTVIYDITRGVHFVDEKLNSNVNDHEKVVQIEQQQNGPDDSNESILELKEKDVSLPERVKILCSLVVNGESKKKTLTLKKDKNDYTLKKIKETLEKASIIKKIVKEHVIDSDKINFNYYLTENGENIKDILNDDDLIKHVILAGDPDTKVPVSIKAELIILDDHE